MSAAEQSDGWIEWAGGECPVAPETVVKIRCLDGLFAIGRADDFIDGEVNWWHNNPFDYQGRPGRSPDDIIAYCVMKL